MERTLRKFFWEVLQDGEFLQFVRQVLYAEVFVAIRQDQAAFDYVLQLPNVAGPVMFGQGVQKLQSETMKPLVVGLGKRLKEILREQRNVFRSLPQGRHVDAHHGNTEVQIFPKGAFLAPFFPDCGWWRK